jgi:hypothetical protein
MCHLRHLPGSNDKKPRKLNRCNRSVDPAWNEHESTLTPARLFRSCHGSSIELGARGRPRHVGFVVSKVAENEVSLRVLRFSPVRIIWSVVRIHSFITDGTKTGEFTSSLIKHLKTFITTFRDCIKNCVTCVCLAHVGLTQSLFYVNPQRSLINF